MNVIIIDASIQEELKQLRQFAEENPLCMDDVLDMKNRQLILDKRHVAFVPADYRVMFSIEWQPKGEARHMSISLVNQPGKLPHPEAVKMIMPLLGFKNPLEKCFIYKEEFKPGHEAIDIVEYVNGPTR